MSLIYGYHDRPTEPDTIEVGGVTYHRLMRLPRNVRVGDRLLIGDNTDRAGYHRTSVTVVDVDTTPTFYDRWHRYPARCTIRFALDGCDQSYRWRSFGPLTWHGEDTKEPTSLYRARS